SCRRTSAFSPSRSGSTTSPRSGSRRRWARGAANVDAAQLHRAAADHAGSATTSTSRSPTTAWRPRRYANLLVTLLVSGLWHGARWTFVVWGALHGAYLVAALLTARAGGVRA